jgi:hypothetical protein
MNVTYSKNGTLLNPQDIANPCGIIAKLYPYGNNIFKDR